MTRKLGLACSLFVASLTFAIGCGDDATTNAGSAQSEDALILGSRFDLKIAPGGSQEFELISDGPLGVKIVQNGSLRKVNTSLTLRADGEEQPLTSEGLEPGLNYTPTRPGAAKVVIAVRNLDSSPLEARLVLSARGPNPEPAPTPTPVPVPVPVPVLEQIKTFELTIPILGKFAVDNKVALDSWRSSCNSWLETQRTFYRRENIDVAECGEPKNIRSPYFHYTSTARVTYLARLPANMTPILRTDSAAVLGAFAVDREVGYASWYNLCNSAITAKKAELGSRFITAYCSQPKNSRSPYFQYSSDLNYYVKPAQ